jgi:2-dehydropantoate 2-reductase
VTLCDVVPELIEPARNRGIIIEGAEHLSQVVSRTCTSVDELANYHPDVVIITVKANALSLIASAIEDFYKDGMYVVSWQNGIDTEKEIANTLGSRPVIRAVWSIMDAAF